MKKPAAKGGRKHLHDDDHDVWSHTAQSIEPLKKAKGRHHPAAERAAEMTPPAAAKHAAEPAKSKPDKAASGKGGAATSAKPKAVPAPPPIATFDRKKVRKIRSGQVEIEARIDLHGMRQDEAHSALVRFLLRCQSKEQRWVLVITGKGKLTDSDPHAPFDLTRPRERGVLKRNVPRWLDEPELRHLVVSYTTAAIQHGGEGALYIHLRKRG
ncbi:MAG: Smr/MutS family protein [Hyphomicrobium sp.]|nr:Smr/MutS family protein [Hyphomicrobium sp.]